MDDGIEQGYIDKTKDIVLNMLKKGIDITEISEITGLSLSEIKQLEK